MPTSGTSTWNIEISDLIEEAYEKAGLDGGQPPNPQNFSLCGLKQMAPVQRMGWLRLNIGPAEPLATD
jgi:hypothetical protein